MLTLLLLLQAVARRMIQRIDSALLMLWIGFVVVWIFLTSCSQRTERRQRPGQPLLLLLFLLFPAHILWQERTESTLSCPIHKASANGGVECCGIDVVSIASNGALWCRQTNQQSVVNNPIKQQAMNLAHTGTYQSPHVMYTMHHAHNGISLLGRTRTVMTHIAGVSHMEHTPTPQAHKSTVHVLA